MKTDIQKVYYTLTTGLLHVEAIAAFARLINELQVTDQLLDERQRVLDAIPPCPSHGACIPHALEWIEAMKAKS